jgi:thiocyanate hydrolase subunit beta
VPDLHPSSAVVHIAGFRGALEDPEQRSKTAMPSRSDLRQLYDVGGQLAPTIHQSQNWPYEIPHDQYEAYLWPPHDVGGQPDVPVVYEEKEEEEWELDTYVTCEVLGWRGVWNAEERRRRGNNDLGLSVYYGFPYYGRWIWAAARMLVDKNHVSLNELLEKIAEVRARYGKR